MFRALTHFLSPYLLLSFPYTLFSSQSLPFLHQSFLYSFNLSFLPLLPPSPGPTFSTLPASPPSLVSLPPHITSSFVPFLLLCSLLLPSTSTFFLTLLLLPSFTGTYFPPLTYFLYIHTSSSSLPPSSFSHPTSSLPPHSRCLTLLSSQSVFP